MAEAARQDPPAGDTPAGSPNPAYPPQGGTPAQKAAWKVPSVQEFGLWSGFEGKEAMLGQGLVQLLKTIIADMPYQHHLNDAVMKAHLQAMQFAKNQGLMKEFIEHDVVTLRPVNKRVAQIIASTGDPEYGLAALFERTDCWYQLVLEWKVEPGRRTWKSPFKTVLEMGKRIGQFDLTEQWIHEEWTIPRLQGYARDLGISITVSPWSEDGWLSCELNK
jgi:hypothetical protein